MFVLRLVGLFASLSTWRTEGFSPSGEEAFRSPYGRMRSDVHPAESSPQPSDCLVKTSHSHVRPLSHRSGAQTTERRSGGWRWPVVCGARGPRCDACANLGYQAAELCDGPGLCCERFCADGSAGNPIMLRAVGWACGAGRFATLAQFLPG